MKEKVISIGTNNQKSWVDVKDCNEYPCYHIEHQRFKCPTGVKTKFKTTIAFQSLLLVYLLNSIKAWILIPAFITDRTVSNKYINIFGIV